MWEELCSSTGWVDVSLLLQQGHWAQAELGVIVSWHLLAL